MRQVKVISTDGMTAANIEVAVNEIMNDIHQNGGYVDKTEYCVNQNTGRIGMVVIEYQ